MDCVSEICRKNRKILKRGFVPETNDVMGQLFSFINCLSVQVLQDRAGAEELDKQPVPALQPQTIQHRHEERDLLSRPQKDSLRSSGLCLFSGFW